jgi:hypothetical protein
MTGYKSLQSTRTYHVARLLFAFSLEKHPHSLPAQRENASEDFVVCGSQVLLLLGVVT